MMNSVGCIILILQLAMLTDVASQVDTDAAHHLRVTTILEPPWTMMQRSVNGTEATGNDRYIGFIPDLVKSICDRIPVDYTLTLVEDGRYGALDANGQWNGMIGSLIRKETDMVAAALTVTSIREKVVNFVHPFKNLGLSILVKRASNDIPENSFINYNVFTPFSLSAWILICLAYLLVSLLTWVYNLLISTEWGPHSKHNQNIWNKQAEHFTLIGSCWMIYTTMVRQGYQVAPRSFASRVLSLSWYFFCALIAILYIANATEWMFIKSENRVVQHTRFKSIDDLLIDENYKFGAIAGGSTQRYVLNSRRADLQRIADSWEEYPSLLVRSTSDGVEKVRQGNYAFIMESTTAEYVCARQCDVETLEETLHDNIYGMAMQEDDENNYFELVNLATLELLNHGYIEGMVRKWFRNGSVCTLDPPRSEYFQSTPKAPLTGLTADMMWQLMLMLLAGCCLSIAVSLVEYIYSRKTNMGDSAQGGSNILQEEMT